MNKVVVGFKKLSPIATPPAYAKPGDAAMDLYALQDTFLLVGEPVAVETGIALEIPDGYFGSIRERSGLALRGFRVGGGVVDSGYRGEVRVIMTFEGDGTDRDLIVDGDDMTIGAKISAGDKIAQLVVQPCANASLVEVDELGETERGQTGFGSTGR